MIAEFELKTGRKLYQGQVEMYLIETWSYGLSLAMEEAQAQAEDYLVAHAGMQGLLKLGTNRWTPRLPAAKASVILTFSLSSPRNQSVVIAQGTRVRSDGSEAVFLTLADVSIPAGSLTVEALAEAQSEGALANNVGAGAITTFLDPIAGVAVTNTAAPDGGADAESAEAYRLRIANAPERISRAGPRDAYREMVMGVSSSILDCAVVRPNPCYIDIYVLTASGDAGDGLKAQVLAALDAETVRPLGDEVTIKACEAVGSAPHLVIRCYSGAGVIEAMAQTEVAQVVQSWRERLGAMIAPSDLTEPIKKLPGVIDVEVQNLSFVALQPWQFMQASVSIEMRLAHE